MPRPLHRWSLTRKQAERAIYVDFEGNVDRVPTLLGVLSADDAGDDHLEQIVVEPLFAGAADSGHGQSVVARDLSAVAVELVRRARRERRHIVSWSLHDREKLLEALDARPMLSAKLRRRHRNAVVTASRWAKREGTRPERNTLASYLSLVGYHVPPEYGPGETGKSLRTIRKSLEAHGGSWDALTTTMRTRFENVLGHNRHDLLGMRAVVLRASAADQGVRALDPEVRPQQAVADQVL